MSFADRTWYLSPGAAWGAGSASRAASPTPEQTLVERFVDEDAPACRVDEPLAGLADRLAARELVPVVQDEETMRFAGVVRASEVSRVSSSRHPTAHTVRDVLGPSRWCWPSDSLEAALAIMRAGRVAELPVIDASQRLLGVVSLGDIARFVEVERERRDVGELEHLLAETRAALAPGRRCAPARSSASSSS